MNINYLLKEQWRYIWSSLGALPWKQQVVSCLMLSPCKSYFAKLCISLTSPRFERKLKWGEKNKRKAFPFTRRVYWWIFLTGQWCVSLASLLEGKVHYRSSVTYFTDCIKGKKQSRRRTGLGKLPVADLSFWPSDPIPVLVLFIGPSYPPLPP